MSKQRIVERHLFEFKPSHQIIYSKHSCMAKLVPEQFIITFEDDNQRTTLAFVQPDFSEMEVQVGASQGVYVALVKDRENGPKYVEVADYNGQLTYFTAHSVKDITPSSR